MKKLSLDDLRVESYASQVSEQELAEVKGGTALPCAYLIVEGIAAAAAVVAAGVAAYAAYDDDDENGSTGTEESMTIYHPTADSVRINGNTYYGFKADSIRIYQ